MSVYRVIDVIGTSSQSWEDAAVTAVSTARKSLRDLRVAEVVEQDLSIEEGGEIIFRTKLRLSFKYEDPTVSRPSGPSPVRQKVKTIEPNGAWSHRPVHWRATRPGRGDWFQPAERIRAWPRRT